VRDCLAAYPWPGNLDELQFVLQQALENSAESGSIDVAHLPIAIRQARVAADAPVEPVESMPGLDEALENLERKLIVAALKKAKGNQTRAAELLSIWRPRLIRRIKALGIESPE